MVYGPRKVFLAGGIQEEELLGRADLRVGISPGLNELYQVLQ